MKDHGIVLEQYHTVRIYTQVNYQGEHESRAQFELDDESVTIQVEIIEETSEISRKQQEELETQLVIRAKWLRRDRFKTNKTREQVCGEYWEAVNELKRRGINYKTVLLRHNQFEP
jgi:aspartyl/asparaginyl-tRNA synthetase